MAEPTHVSFWSAERGDEPRPAGAIAGLILASGMSRRFAGANKLLLPVAGHPLIHRTVQAYLEAPLDLVLVVVGYQGARVAAALSDTKVRIVFNHEFAAGQSRALVRGVDSLPPDVEAAVIGVGDQPLLTSAVVSRLIEVYRRSGARLVVPHYGDQRGNPVLLHRTLFPELRTVQGDQGGRTVLARHQDEIEWLEVGETEIGADLDSPEDYRRLLRSLRGRSRGHGGEGPA